MCVCGLLSISAKELQFHPCCKREVAMDSQRKRWHLLAVTVTLMAGTFAVGAERKYSIMDPPKTVTVTEKDSKVSLARGDMLVVRLEIMGEDYLWQIAKNDKALLKPLDKVPVDKVGKAPPPKGADLQVFYLTAEAAGTVVLELEYRSRADKDAKPAKTYKVTVQID
jgi:hypothetical protein